ncbi:hypothetical protein OJAV_G00088600 [Oryzias javanicus]|uniref:CCHC-type domain-containing protein n=1 Tax=Oryzias javanicus TaxID=123683 RepID=A0A437CZS6_ORYJA|nr:hypothetical protein OJAV_G00088600 [Oryzias javanicus]
MANRLAGVQTAQLVFDGSEEKYELWETRFLGYLHSLKLKETILTEPVTEEQLAADRSKNADCYAELIRLIDDKSLSLIRHEAADKGREALKILRDHYSGKSKPRIINLYTALTRLKMAEHECVTDYMIRAENTITALRDAGENMSDGLLIAMILGGLPDSFKPLAVHVTQNEDTVTFTDFKRRLRVYEEAEKMSKTESTDNVMKTYVKQEQMKNKARIHYRKEEEDEMTCYKCGKRGHIARRCQQKVWCNFCKNNTHKETICKKKGRQDGVRKVTEDMSGSTDHFFKAKAETPASKVKMKGIMVDAGATSHIVNDIRKFTDFDESFNAERHTVELADGTKVNGTAQRRGTAMIRLVDCDGQQHRAYLRDALFMPTYPHDIFSVARAANEGTTITFKKGESHLITKNRCRRDRAILCGKTPGDSSKKESNSNQRNRLIFRIMTLNVMTIS